MQQGLGNIFAQMAAMQQTSAASRSSSPGFWSQAGSFLTKLAPIAEVGAEVGAEYLRRELLDQPSQQQQLDQLLSRFLGRGTIMPQPPGLPPPPRSAPPPPQAQGFTVTTPMVLAGLGAVAAVLMLRR